MSDMTETFDATYDVIVIGGGSAGCVVASRLTEAPDVSLCLIEAGPRDRNPWIHIPLGMGKLIPDPKMNWGYATQPEPGLGGRRVGWARGKVLGGSGSINGLVFLRGPASDYDAWERLGARGWSYQDVLPYFKRLEHNARGADEWRGTGGPMHISDIAAPSPAARAFVEACDGLQYRRNSDFNGERIDGAGYVQLNVRRGWRWSTAAGYLKPNLSRPNLELMTSTHVRRILIDKGRAIGVEVELADGTRQRIGARRRVVLSGGAINSPVLLLASGIGPAAELGEAGVGVVHDLPGVGKSLQDHPQARFVFRTDSPGTLNEVTRKPLQAMRMGLQWLVNGTGQLAVGAVEATLFAKSRPSEPEVDLQFQVLNFSSDNLREGLNRFAAFTIIFGVCRPQSRGEIRLADAEGRKAPRIFANYLTHEEDWRGMLAGFRICRQIAATEPFKSLIAEEMHPGPVAQSDEEARAYIRAATSTTFHPCGTCRMGEDAMAVVDSALSVRGLQGLSVVDASVMPQIPSPNIHPATIMLAEKGADLIAAQLR